MRNRRWINLRAWVMRTLWLTPRPEFPKSVAKRLKAVRSAVGNTFPTCDIDQMLSEIGAGYDCQFPGSDRV
jgi:hypothetical protein